MRKEGEAGESQNYMILSMTYKGSSQNYMSLIGERDSKLSSK